MQSVNFNSASKAQAFTAVKHSNSSPVSVTNELKKDSVSFTGKGEAKNGNVSVIKQIVKAVIGAVAAVISFIIGKIAAKPETPAEVDTSPAAETAPKAGATPKADVIEPEEVAEAKNAAEAAPTETAEVTDEAQKEILKLVNGAEKEIKEYADAAQVEAKIAYKDVFRRIDKLVEIAKNDGKDFDGKTVGVVEYDPDKNICTLISNKNNAFVMLTNGTNELLGARLEFEDGSVVEIDAKHITIAKKGRKMFIFDRLENNRLHEYFDFGFDEASGMQQLKFSNGKVAEYSIMDTSKLVTADFSDVEMVKYEEINRTKKDIKLTKSFEKAADGTWKDLTQEK